MNTLKENNKKIISNIFTKIKMVRAFSSEPDPFKDEKPVKKKRKAVDYKYITSLAHSNDQRHFQSKGIRDKKFIHMIKSLESDLKKVDKIPPLSNLSSNRSVASRKTSAVSMKSQSSAHLAKVKHNEIVMTHRAQKRSIKISPQHHRLSSLENIVGRNTMTVYAQKRLIMNSAAGQRKGIIPYHAFHNLK